MSGSQAGQVGTHHAPSAMETVILLHVSDLTISLHEKKRLLEHDFVRISQIVELAHDFLVIINDAFNVTVAE